MCSDWVLSEAVSGVFFPVSRDPMSGFIEPIESRLREQDRQIASLDRWIGQICNQKKILLNIRNCFRSSPLYTYVILFDSNLQNSNLGLSRSECGNWEFVKPKRGPNTSPSHFPVRVNIMLKILSPLKNIFKKIWLSQTITGPSYTLNICRSPYQNFDS